MTSLGCLILLFQYILGLAFAEQYPTNDYAPGTVSCPEGMLIREANGISSGEQNWLTKRKDVTQDNLKLFLKNVAKLNESDYEGYLSGSNTIKVGLAFSGGGYRAMLSGAGQISALDSRTKGASEHGLGGLLQSSTYLAGLSGGNWMVGTLVVNNWTSVQDILDGKAGGLWSLTNAIYDAGGKNLIKTMKVWHQIIKEVKEKVKAGYIPSITDIWGRALARQFFTKETGYGVSTTWSGIRDLPAFSGAQMPFPISVSNLRINGETVLWKNSTVFEANPYELGSWDNTANTFVDIKYLGTKMSNGISNGVCVNGFDNAGFIMGTSSSLFDSLLDSIKSKISVLKIVWALVKKQFKNIAKLASDEAIYEPNPLYYSTYTTRTDLKLSDKLPLVDGGTDLQNVPLLPLLMPQRNIDVIFAYDNSADTEYHWPNGSSLYWTYSRQFMSIGKDFSLPPVPTVPDFIKNNFTNRPVFFGCDSHKLPNMTHTPPLVVYTANSHYSYASNTSTYKMAYTDKERNSIIQNGFEVASRNNLTDDSTWAGCVGCAIIRRSQERANQQQSDFCKSCFKDYCWNGPN